MKVKLTGHWGEHQPGDVVEVDEATARNLVAGGALDEVKPARGGSHDTDRASS